MPKPPTPEAIHMKAVVEDLRLCRIGKIKRVNTGQARIGNAPTHPWAKDARRFVRFGEVGASDLQIELEVNDPRIPIQYRGRDLYPEVKRADWKPPTVPKFGASRSTLAKYRHHVEQVAFLKRQADRGNLGWIVRSPYELYLHLSQVGFSGLPVPAACPLSSPTTSRRTKAAPLKSEPVKRERDSQ